MKHKLIILGLVFLANFSFADYQFETIVSGLDDAWSFDFLNDDQVILTEQPGKIKIITISCDFMSISWNGFLLISV